MHSRPLIFGIQELADSNLYSKVTTTNAMVNFLHNYQDFFHMQASEKNVVTPQLV